MPRFSVSFLGSAADSTGKNAPERRRHPRPQSGVSQTQVPAIAAKQFIRTLTHERDLDILPGPFADEVHRHDRR